MPTAAPSATRHPENVAVAAASYGRCVLSPSYFDEFYGSFLAKSAEFATMFRHTDMNKQKLLLREGISLMLSIAKDPGGFARDRLEHLGDSHSRAKLNIRPELYSLWVSSLLETVRKHDPMYSAAVESSWQESLEVGLTIMKSRY